MVTEENAFVASSREPQEEATRESWFWKDQAVTSMAAVRKIPYNLSSNSAASYWC